MAEPDIQELSVLPEQAQEDALHANRLLAIEERPFQRVTKDLLSKDSPLRYSLSYLPSPPPEGEDEVSPEYDAQKIEKFREDVLIDFASLESSIIRIQLILSSNERERERYAAEKAKILETAQAVRDNTVELRSQLVDAQRVLEQRRGYDEQASKILDDRKLKSRDETKVDIDKLEKEIEDLQHESAEYEVTWVSRKEQFNNIVREGEAMIRQIKGIKDEPEPEKDENMEDGDDGLKAETSRMQSPAPDARSPQHSDLGGATPMHDGGEGGATPRPANKFLEVDEATRTNSRVSSPHVQATQVQDDIEMGEASIADSSANEQKVAESMEATETNTPQVSTPTADVAMDDS
ncbi:hypothetical protein M409DRAFT_15787 [Zasmidium cellare ATCC 36951]|uniref:Uncharacterized protein n=1 Tax=Zasmidium cellare ATCC 36951 TaxID=1080233 RepID=A0A6A6D278_ZASCE|nr:uncharacterized protein M409DRAFT_15787 [Zasmidium cellare ATCC 36951]KAF2173507.1 hypothetical protein M409DRAFT_15787 [Zasmidium cellare ATCC 36951]